MSVLGGAVVELPLEPRVHNRHTREIIAAAKEENTFVNLILTLWLVERHESSFSGGGGCQVEQHGFCEVPMLATC